MRFYNITHSGVGGCYLVCPSHGRPRSIVRCILAITMGHHHSLVLITRHGWIIFFLLETWRARQVLLYP